MRNQLLTEEAASLQNGVNNFRNGVSMTSNELEPKEDWKLRAIRLAKKIADDSGAKVEVSFETVPSKEALFCSVKPKEPTKH